MEKLDQLITKFQEAKEELKKSEDLEKFYVSPVTRLAGKKDNPASAKPKAGPTGIDKIKAVSKQPISPTSIVSEDQARAKAMGAPTNPTAPNKPAKLTGLDRIKAESQKPITSTTVKKDEDEDDVEEKAKKKLEEVKKALDSKTMSGKMLGGTASKLTHPQDTGRANMLQDALAGAYSSKPAAAQAHIPMTQPKKLTGLDRVRAEAAKPIAKDEDVKKDDETTAVSPPKLDSQGRAMHSVNGRTPVQAGQVLPGGQHLHGVGLNTPPQGSGNSLPMAHQVADVSNRHTGNVSPVLSSIPKLKPAGQAQYHLNTDKPVSERVFQPSKTSTLVPMMSKTVNGSYAPDTNMVKEELAMSKNGQWSLNKASPDKPGHCDSCGNGSDDLRDGMCGDCDSANFATDSKPQLETIQGAAKVPAPSKAKLKVLPGGIKKADDKGC